MGTCNHVLKWGETHAAVSRELSYECIFCELDRCGAENVRLTKELADAQYWRERHGQDAVAFGRLLSDNWEHLRQLRKAATAAGANQNNPDCCGVCGKHFAECEEDVFVVPADDTENDLDIPTGREFACAGALIRAALRATSTCGWCPDPKHPSPEHHPDGGLEHRFGTVTTEPCPDCGSTEGGCSEPAEYFDDEVPEVLQCAACGVPVTRNSDWNHIVGSGPIDPARWKIACNDCQVATRPFGGRPNDDPMGWLHDIDTVIVRKP